MMIAFNTNIPTPSHCSSHPGASLNSFIALSENLATAQESNVSSPLKQDQIIEQNALNISSEIKLQHYSRLVSNFEGDQKAYTELNEKILQLAIHTSKQQVCEQDLERSIQEKNTQNETLKTALTQSSELTIGIDLNEKLANLHSENFKNALSRINAGYQKNISPEINKGACASLKLMDDANTCVGIYKQLNVPAETLSYKRALEINLKWLFGIKRPTDYLAGAMAESKGFAEKLAYDLDQYLEFNLVPETNFMCASAFSPEKQIGCLQLYMEGYKEAAEIFMDPIHKVNPNEDELFLFQKFIIEDFLFGNLDRKPDNWMVKLDEDGRLVDIAMIDNGNSFIAQNPAKEDSYILANQYMWGEHPYGKFAFIQRSIDLLERLDKEKIIEFLKLKKIELMDFPKANSFFIDDVVNRILERIDALKTVVKNGNTPHNLAQIKTVEDFIKLKNQIIINI